MSASISKSEWDHWCNEFGESHQTIVVFVAIITSTIISFCIGLKSKTSAEPIPFKIANPNHPLARLRLSNGCSLELMS